MRRSDLGAKGFTRGRSALALSAIVLLAAALRLVGVDWDEGRYLHPDERFLAQVESALDSPSSLREYFDTHRSPLNPNTRGFGFYVYGTLPLFAVHAVGSWLGQPGNDLDRRLLGRELGADYAAVSLVGRGLSALCDLVTTLLVFAIGARLYGRRVGVLACALYAVAVLPIQQAHFFTVDAMATMWAAAALWAAARVATGGRWFDDVAFGVSLGAALACKVSLFPLAALIAVAVVLRSSTARGERAPLGSFRRRLVAEVARAALSVNVAVIATILTFRLLQPYAFVPPYGGPPPPVASQRVVQSVLNLVAPRLNPVWMEQMSKANRQQVGDDDSPPNHQWASRAPLLYPWLNLVRFGLGWPLGLAAWLGWAWALLEGLRGRGESARHVLLVAWVGLYFSWTGSGWVTSMRYLLPIYPALAIIAAWALLRFAAPDGDPSLPGAAAPTWTRRVLGSGAIAAIFLASAAWAWAFSGIYRQPHTRIAASRWIYARLPAAATLRFDSATGRVEQVLALPTTAPVDGPDRDPAEPEVEVTVVAPEAPVVVGFRPPAESRLARIRFHHLARIGGPSDPATVEVSVADAAEGSAEIGRCGVLLPAATADDVECTFGSLALAAEHEYSLRIEASARLAITGAAIAHEGSWDDAIPMPLANFEARGRFAFYALEMVWEDDVNKRRRLQSILDRVDYLTISSNRFYDSLRRNPRRWPMSLDYYQALFDGSLGFDLVADFSATPTFGPISIDDQRAEEAFTVYDHPRVMIFRKTVAYSPERTERILGRVDLDTVVRPSAGKVAEPPAVLSLPPLRRDRVSRR